MWIGIFSVFGASFFMMTDAGYQCVTGYGCDDLGIAAGRFFLAPQIDMANAIDNIKMQEESEELNEYEVSTYKRQIIASALVTLLLVILFTWLIAKSMTTLNGFDYFLAFICALAIISLLQIIIGYIITGEFIMPFIGFIKILQYPEVLIGVINYSEVLPLNQSIPLNNT